MVENQYRRYVTPEEISSSLLEKFQKFRKKQTELKSRIEMREFEIVSKLRAQGVLAERGMAETDKLVKEKIDSDEEITGLFKEIRRIESLLDTISESLTGRFRIT